MPCHAVSVFSHAAFYGSDVTHTRRRQLTRTHLDRRRHFNAVVAAIAGMLGPKAESCDQPWRSIPELRLCPLPPAPEATWQNFSARETNMRSASSPYKGRHQH